MPQGMEEAEAAKHAGDAAVRAGNYRDAYTQ